MLRRTLIVCLVASGAIGVKDARPQGPKLVRVTYPVADLVVPITDHTAFPERQPQKETKALPKDSLARDLVGRITATIAKESWQAHGGTGTIQYFPLGLALVVEQTQDVHRQVARLLAESRREQEVQVSIELRLITVSPKLAARFLKDMKQQGQPVRDAKDADGIVCVNEKFVVDLLSSVQGDRMAHILQSPKITVFDRQGAGIDGAGIRCDFRPTVDAERKNVLLHVDLELATKRTASPGVSHRDLVNAVGTFAVPSGETIAWHLGQTRERTHRFALVTPRVLVVKDEEPGVFLGAIPPIPGR